MNKYQKAALLAGLSEIEFAAIKSLIPDEWRVKWHSPELAVVAKIAMKAFEQGRKSPIKYQYLHASMAGSFYIDCFVFDNKPGWADIVFFDPNTHEWEEKCVPADRVTVQK